MTVGYLGPSGSYSSLAADKLYKNQNKIEYNNFYALFKALSGGEINCAVIPIENSLQGSVSQCLDLLYSSQDILIDAEIFVDIEHRLIVKRGASLTDIKTIYSHEQAIKQCGRFLSEYLDGAKIVYTDSTAASVQRIRDISDAGIVGSHISAENLQLLPELIADEPKNQTRFVSIKKAENIAAKNSKKIFIAATGKNKPGALLEILTVLSSRNLNMSKIESRPLKTTIGEYVFFIEFEGDILSEDIQNVFKALNDKNISFKNLGAY